MDTLFRQVTYFPSLYLFSIDGVPVTVLHTGLRATISLCGDVILCACANRNQYTGKFWLINSKCPVRADMDIKTESLSREIFLSQIVTFTLHAVTSTIIKVLFSPSISCNVQLYISALKT